MAGQGKISVELRLVLDKLNADIRAAAASMKAGLGKDIGQTASGTEKAATAMDKLGRAVRETNKGLRDQEKAALAAWRASLPRPQVSLGSKQRNSYLIGQMRYKGAEEPGPQQSIQNPGYGLATPPTLGGRRKAGPGEEPPAVFCIPTPPVLQTQTTLLGKLNNNFQQLLQNRAALNAASGFVGRFGLSGGVTALRAGAVGVGIAGVVASLLLFRKALNEATAASESARRSYLGAVRSGAPLGFSIERGTLAQAMGVSESEVFRFGRVITWMGDRVSAASRTFVETNSVLTGTAFSIRIMKVNFDALKASIAAQLAPAIASLANAMSSLFETLARTDAIKIAANLIGNVFHQIKLGVIGLSLALQNAVVGLQLMIDSLEFLFSRNRAVDFFKETREGMAGMNKMVQALMGQRAPDAVASINRLQASSWERMGLVIGTGSGTNYNREIARNTKATVGALQQLLNILPRTGTPNQINYNAP